MSTGEPADAVAADSTASSQLCSSSPMSRSMSKSVSGEPAATGHHERAVCPCARAVPGHGRVALVTARTLVRSRAAADKTRSAGLWEREDAGRLGIR